MSGVIVPKIAYNFAYEMQNLDSMVFSKFGLDSAFCVPESTLTRQKLTRQNLHARIFTTPKTLRAKITRIHTPESAFVFFKFCLFSPLLAKILAR